MKKLLASGFLITVLMVTAFSGLSNSTSFSDRAEKLEIGAVSAPITGGSWALSGFIKNYHP